MKVRELIERLALLDPELVVVIPEDDAAELCEVHSAEVDTIEIANGTMSLAYAHEAGATAVVRLSGPRLAGERCHGSA